MASKGHAERDRLVGHHAGLFGEGVEFPFDRDFVFAWLDHMNAVRVSGGLPKAGRLLDNGVEDTHAARNVGGSFHDRHAISIENMVVVAFALTNDDDAVLRFDLPKAAVWYFLDGLHTDFALPNDGHKWLLSAHMIRVDEIGFSLSERPSLRCTNRPDWAVIDVGSFRDALDNQPIPLAVGAKKQACI